MSKLADCVEILDYKRVPISQKERKKLKKIYPYYGAQGIIDYVEDYIFDGKYILVAEDGENLKSRNQNIASFVEGKFWVNNHAHILGAKEGSNLKYVYYLLSSLDLSGLVTGTAQPKLRQDNLSSLDLSLPDLETQNKVANFLYSLDKKIQNNKKQIETLESLAKTIYDYWFMQFDFPNEEDKPYKSSGGKMVWNEELKREIPDSWSCVQLSAVFSFIKGKLPEKIFATKEKGLEPYITIDVANGGHPLYCSPKNMILCNSESIMVMDGAASGDVYIGPKGILGSTFSMIKLKRSDVSNSLIYMMLSSLKKSYVRANTGSTVPHANIRYIEQLKVAIPKNCLALSERIDASFENINLLKKQIQELYSLKLFLLPLLMNGQVSLSKKYAQNFEAVLK